MSPSHPLTSHVPASRGCSLPDELIVLLTAMTPIGELRASIPLAITSMEMPWPRALGLSIVGAPGSDMQLLALAKAVMAVNE